MASILRSSKFVRYIAGFARNVVLNTPREFDGSLVNTTQCLCGAIPRAFTTQIPAQHDLESSLRRLDQDVRKVGRISRRDIEDVLEEIRSTRSATSSQSLLVIRCCGNLVPEELPEVRTKLVQEIWRTLNKLNVPMDVSHYNALLRVYLENEHPFSPTEFLADLESKGIEPNRVTYQRLIARYCQEGDIEGATKILEFMKEKQLPVNESVFNALIVGHSQTGDMDSAKGILSVMTQAGLEPSADTYTTLLCGFGKKGDIDSINNILAECDSKEVFLLDKDYLDLIYALATNGHSEYVPDILTKVRRAIGYNQDAINLCLRLINKNQEDTGFLILETIVRSTSNDGSLSPVGSFFVKQLVKANKPAEKIVELCNKLEEKGMYRRALPLATEVSLELGNDTLAYPLLQELTKKDIPIRQHYFWPLLIAKAKINSNAVVNILTKMQEYGITPNGETLREYVIPHLKGKSGDILAILRAANISIGSAASCLVHHLIIKNDLKEAALISSQVGANYHPELLRRPLTSALYTTKDLDNYIKIVRNIHENLDRGRKNEEEEHIIDSSEVVGNLLLDLSSQSQEFFKILENVLDGLISEGLSISTVAAEKLQEKLGGRLTEKISSQLSKLSSGDLTPIPVVRKPPSYTPSHQMNIEQLERLIHNLEAKNQETKGLKRQLLTLYYREKNLGKVEQLLEEMKKFTDFVWSPGLHAQLIDLYAQNDQLEKALTHYEQLKELQGEGFNLDESKTIALAHLLVRSGQFEEAIKIIENTPKEKRGEERNFNYSAQAWRFLNALAVEGKVAELDVLFDTLVKNEFVEVSNTLLGPLIKVHLVNKDLDQALEKFEWCVNQFRATPWKNELACQLIQNEDAEKLQKLTDMSTSVHGEINSLYDLVFAFVECGRLRQARKILETPGLQNRSQRINNRCERYRHEGKVKTLEGLKDATKDLDHINRNDIYYQLLLSYIKQDEPDKALGLWTQMQEEDLLPNDEFLVSLGTFLQSKNIQVPFQIPAVQQSLKPVIEERPSSSGVNALRSKIKNNDVDAALHEFDLNDRQFSITDSSILVEKLIQNERIGEATKITLNMLENNQIPLTRVFKFLLNRLANLGDLETINQIGSRISSDMKKQISFDNRLCHANLVAGKASDYLDSLEKEIESANDTDLKDIEEKFPRGGAYGILERQPELLDKYESVALKFGNKGIIAPLNVLWTNYFIKGDDAKADDIWNKYLKNAPRIMFQKVVHTAREEKDETLIRKLIEHLKSSSVTEGALGNAYSCLLDVLVAEEKNDEVVSTFETAIKESGLVHINRTAILRVKEVFDKLGLPFKHSVPPKNVKSSISSSSEEGKK